MRKEYDLIDNREKRLTGIEFHTILWFYCIEESIKHHDNKKCSGIFQERNIQTRTDNTTQLQAHLGTG